MSPRAGRRARAYGDRGPGVDGAGRQRRGAAPERGLAVQPMCERGRLGVRARRAGGHRTVLPSETRKTGFAARSSRHIRAFQRGTKIVRPV